MADELYVLNEGESVPSDFTATPTLGTYNIKTSVNPRAISTNVTSSSTLGINCYEIHTNDEVASLGMASGTVSSSLLNRLFPVSATVADYAENVLENPGYRVTIDTGSATGLSFVTSGTNERDYFIVIYADNTRKHHVAKLEKNASGNLQTQYDGNYYSYEFTPRLKENITAGTKVAIYQGPKITDDVVAVGYGLLNFVDDIVVTGVTVTFTGSVTYVSVSEETAAQLRVGMALSSTFFPTGTTISTIDGTLITTSQNATSVGSATITFFVEERHDKYVDISRPTFYFYNNDKLDNDRKYKLFKATTNVVGVKESVFKTASISSDVILDKGFFTHHGDLTDNNRANDNLSPPREINAYNAQGSTYTFDITHFAGSSKNIYDSDGGLSTYITFIDSPLKNQIHSSPYYINVNKTVTNKGNMATVKFFDVERILDKKINTYERFKIKQFINEKNLDRVANNALPGTCTKTTTNTFTVSGLSAGEDWRKIIGDSSLNYDVVYIEGSYYEISGITAPTNAEQVVTVNRRRALNDVRFGLSALKIEEFSSVKAYRKTWSPIAENFIAGHQIDTQISFAGDITRNGIDVIASESDVNGLEYLLEDVNNTVVVEVEKGDKDCGYTEIVQKPASNFFTNKYLTDAITGNLIVNNPIFEGFVETKKASVNQSFEFEIVGRDSINKLLNTSLDKNYIHSEEFVYSTFNPIVGDVTNFSFFINLSPQILGSGTNTSGPYIIVDRDADGLVSYGDVIALRVDSGTSTDRYIIIGVVQRTETDSGIYYIYLMKDFPIDSSALSYVGSSNLDRNIHLVTKTLIPHKNLETSPRITNRATSIVGTLDKGIVYESGHNFDINGDKELLISTVESSNVLNGHNIDEFSTPITDSDGNYLDFPIGIKTSLNIAASTPELNIISSNVNGNGSISYELGYVSPIVLGMVVKNSNDKFIDSGSDVKTHPIRLVNGQGLPDGGFLHLLSSYTNYDYSPKTFYNEFKDDPSLNTSVYSNYFLRYNQPIFRYANKAFTPNQQILQPYSDKWNKRSQSRFNNAAYNSSLYSRNDYYEKTRNINFYLSAYKVSKQVLDFDKDNSSNWLKGYPKEQTGLYPALGSRFFDIDRVPTWYYNSNLFFGNRFTDDTSVGNLHSYVGKLELHDPSALSMHLFSLGDVYPESKTNQNNIFYLNRNIDNYSLIFKKNKTENNENNNTGYDNFVDENSPQKINVSSRRDDDYHIEPISSSSGDKIRFNLMRLTDVTYDMLFNDVDYENYETGDNMGQLTKIALSDNGVNPAVMIKSFPQAGLHNVDVKVGSPHSALDKLNVTTTDWYYGTEYKYHIYYYPTNQDYPKYVGLVQTVTTGVIDFTADIDQAVDVTDTVLYVQVHYNEIGSEKTKLLLTEDSTIPYLKESTTVKRHNYNKTGIFSNSDLESDNNTGSNDTFVSTTSMPTSLIVGNDIDDTKSKILRTPIIVTGIDGNHTVQIRQLSVMNDMTVGSHFKMGVNADVTGDTITLTDSNSRLTDFFDTHIKTSIGVSGPEDGDSHSGFQDWQFVTGHTGLPNLAADDDNRLTLYSGTTCPEMVGMKINARQAGSGVTGQDYIITKVESSTAFRVHPNHNNNGSIQEVTSMPQAIYSATGGNGFFIIVEGLTDTTDNRLYRVSGVTDTVLTLEDMGGNNPNMATENGVDIIIRSFYVRDKNMAITGSSASSTNYKAAWTKTINGIGQPLVFSAYVNDVVPHRAYYDAEDFLTHEGLDTIVAAFHDIPRMFEHNGYKMLSPDMKEIRGAYCPDKLTRPLLHYASYRKGDDGTSTPILRWDKGVFLQFNTANEGILSENYAFAADVHGEKIYGGEVLFKPYITYSSTMEIPAGIGSTQDSTLNTNEKMLKFDINQRWQTSSTQNNWINYCNNLTGYYFYNETDGELHKIISHEINRNETDVIRHLIKIDNTGTLGNNDILRLMRINQVCMYDFSPNVIELNTPKIEYTKVCGENKMHTLNYDATRYLATDSGEGMVLDSTEGGVKSMYILIDPDGNNTSGFLETRNSTDANYNQLSTSPIKMSATDGIDSFVTSVGKLGNTVLEFSNVKKLLGTPSFGSTFTVTVNKSPQFNPDTVCIGAAFKIVDELETVIDDALTINDIDYTKSSGDKYFGAFNFSGQSLYSATNNLLSYKNKEIVVDGEQIKIASKEDEKKYRNIILSSKNSDYKITSVTNDVSLLDNFDEVIVIGDGVRGIARSPIDANDRNRTIKTKEIYDYSILGQQQADAKAIQYLNVFNTANTSIQVEVADEVPFLKPGQIIELEFEEQNINRGEYLIIEIEKEFGSPTKFILSEYNKDLAGTFALLLGEIRNLQGFTRQKVYTSTTIPRIKRGLINVKFVKATGTLSTSGATVTSTIGFGYTIGFNSEVGV